MNDVNPFTMVFDALWAMLEAHPRFVRDVNDRNRIKFNVSNDRDPLKEVVQVADLPEVCLKAATTTANVMETSSSSKCVNQYQIMVSTGDFRYTAFLAIVEWYIFVAMCGWKTRLASLRWKNKSFVKRVNVINAIQGLSDPKANRNIEGWSCVWQIEVEMHFETQNLLDELKNPLPNSN